MGFTADNLRSDDSATGKNIYNALRPFCGSSTSPIRQLCEKLGCLTQRPPKSLGDLFGFYWQVTGQLFNDVKNKDKDPTSLLSSAITTLLAKLTTVKSGLLYDSITANVESIGNNIFGLSWHCHWKNSWRTDQRKISSQYCDDHTSSKTACDLMSLYDSECENKSCGGYLYPLTHSDGATYAPAHAAVYLSRVLYLTDELYESLQEFLDTFNDIKCTGCKSSCNSHSSGSHGSQSSCHCRSVVECSDVLPHLYANGFTFHNAHWLRGRDYNGSKWQENTNKRTCANFHTQLQSVINGEPLTKLLQSIDDFLFLFRYYFLSNLSAFWTIYVCIILYTFFFLLDTLHFRSHLKLTASHMVPPLTLLTSGTPLPITKLAYIVQ